MNRVEGLLIDLSGVVYQGEGALPGSVKAIGLLREAGLPLRFLTNTTNWPIRAIVAKLRELGVNARRQEVFTPAVAARAYLRNGGLSPRLLAAPELAEDFADFSEGASSALVIGDARDGFTYASLNDAFRRIEDGAELVALASNRMFIDYDGAPSLDVGAFVAALEYATGKEAVVLGKPAPAFFTMAVADMGLEPGRVAMIGDDLEFDVLAAIDAGLKGWLVRTGKEAARKTSLWDREPDAVFRDLLAAVESHLKEYVGR